MEVGSESLRKGGEGKEAKGKSSRIQEPQAWGQLCPSLCHPMDCSLPGSFVHGILQARITGVGCSSSREFARPRDQTRVSCISCIGRPILYHKATWEVVFTMDLAPFGSRKLLTPSFPLGSWV